jgi:hypothetical protein
MKTALGYKCNGAYVKNGHEVFVEKRVEGKSLTLYKTYE